METADQCTHLRSCYVIIWFGRSLWTREAHLGSQKWPLLRRFDEVLGEGTFSTVYLAESKMEPDGWVAIKVIEKRAAMGNIGKDLPEHMPDQVIHPSDHS